MIVIVGGIVRGLIAAGELLWLDELHTSWVVSGKLGEVAGRAADGNQAPLYFWLTWIPVHLFGESEFCIRAISLLAGLGVLLVSAGLVWRVTGSGTATALVAGLIGFDLQFIHYATEARPYALIQLLGVIQVALFCQAFIGQHESNATPRWYIPHPMLGIVSTALFYVHYTGAWVFMAEGMFLCGWLVMSRIKKNPETRNQAWQTGLRLLVTASATGIACLPIFARMFIVFQRRNNWSSVSSIGRTLSEQIVPLALWIAIPILGWGIFVLLNSHLHDSKNGANNTQASTIPGKTRMTLAILVLLWAIVPTLGVVGMDYWGVAPMALPRYTMVGAAAFPVFAGLITGYVPVRRGRIAIALTIVSLSLWHNPVINYGIATGQLPLLRNEDWKSPVDELNTNLSKKEQPVFLFSNLIEDVDALTQRNLPFQEYLRFPVLGMYRANRNGREIIARPTMPLVHFVQSDIEKVGKTGGAWILLRTPDLQLLDEIENELRQKLFDMFGRQAGEIRSSRKQTPGSPVYLLSVDM